MSNNRLELEDLAILLEEQADRKRYRRLDYSFPSDGVFARSHYPNHLRLFSAGSSYSERAFVAPNRVGKTYAASYEMALHLTGLYPTWWEGKRFNHPILGWASGTTTQKTVEIVQEALLGPIHDEGSGMIPKHLLVGDPKSWPGVSGGRISFACKHFTNGVEDGISQCTFKSYDQGRRGFEGKAVHFIWLDEEPLPDVYTECLTRTATTKGQVLSTFTPLSGISDIFLSFVPDMVIPHDGIVAPKNGIGKSYKYTVGEDWDNYLPHLSQEEKDRVIAGLLPWELSARTKGIPSLGSGAVYPVDSDVYICEPFDIPAYWPKFAGMDVGWKKTAVVWFALDEKSDTAYVYSEYYRGYAEPAIHADAIKARGLWIPIAIDPASNQRNQKDGDRLMDLYSQYGLNLTKADNSVHPGILEVFQRLSTGRLKIFSTAQDVLKEIRMYRKDEKGQIIKENDHAMDAMRYGIKTGLQYATLAPSDDDDVYQDNSINRDSITGY